MIHHTPADHEQPKTVVFVTVVEGPDALPEVAFLAAALRAAGVEPVRFPADFCSDEKVFQSELLARKPLAVWFHYTTEWREMVAHGASVAREVYAGPIYFVGSAVHACRGSRLPVPEVAGVTLLPRADEESLLLAMGLPSPDLSSLVPDEAFFGEGLLRRPVSTSLFAEPLSVGVVATREAMNRRSPVALLARLAAPRFDGPMAVTPAVIRSLADRLKGFRRLEWWDRSFPPSQLELLSFGQTHGFAQSIRLLPEAVTDTLLSQVADRGVDRVILECDRIAGVAHLPQSSATAEDLVPLVESLREHGLSVGILLAVGLPHETRIAALHRIDLIRSLGPDQIRCIPFEPTGGHPAFDYVADLQMLPSESGRWKREVYRPLRQPGLPLEDFVEIWSRAMLLHAEVSAGGLGVPS